jgi:hypothetical protein
MRYPAMWVDLFKDGTEKEKEFSLFALRELLEAMVKINVGWIASHGDEFEPLYKFAARTGLQWEPEKGTEDWLTIPCIYQAKAVGKPVDCEDLAMARVAELRMGLGGHPLGPIHAIADIRGRVMPDTRQVRMHAFVRYPDGTVEDPSKKLGMPGEGADSLERRRPAALVSHMQDAARVATSGALVPAWLRRAA